MSADAAKVAKKFREKAKEIMAPFNNGMGYNIVTPEYERAIARHSAMNDIADVFDKLAEDEDREAAASEEIAEEIRREEQG